MDVWRACPRCGSPFGFNQCDLCNQVYLEHMGRTRLPFSACVSAVLFDEQSGQLVRIFKDAGEQRLSLDLARIMKEFIPVLWQLNAITFIPATKAAYRHRGFDHAALLAQELARLLGLPVFDLLGRPLTKDQRAYGARERIANLSHRFSLRPDLSLDERIDGLLLIDDVFTTGSTLCAACDALEAIANSIYCATFARV